MLKIATNKQIMTLSDLETMGEKWDLIMRMLGNSYPLDTLRTISPVYRIA
jgi:hypothetical protein